MNTNPKLPTLSEFVLARIAQSGTDRFWTVSDFHDSGWSARSIDRTLLRLAESGKLRRVRHGLYWHGRPTAFGMTLPDDLSVAARVADVAGTGPAGLSAANELGLTTQVPGLTLVAAPRRPPSPMATVRFVDRAGRRARATQRLSPTEVALLEVLGDWDEVVDAPAEARDRLVSLIHSGTVRPDRLAAASETEPANVRGRLRALLHDADEAAAANRVRQPSGRVAAMLALP